MIKLELTRVRFMSPRIKDWPRGNRTVGSTHKARIACIELRIACIELRIAHIELRIACMAPGIALDEPLVPAVELRCG